MANKHRLLYILKYLWYNTDENHPVITTDILLILKNEIYTNRKLVVLTKVRQNKYSIDNRILELAELMIVNDIQAAKFTSEIKSIAHVCPWKSSPIRITKTQTLC